MKSKCYFFENYIEYARSDGTEESIYSIRNGKYNDSWLLVKRDMSKFKQKER